MSNIPAARKMLVAIYQRLVEQGQEEEAEQVHEALSLLFRKRPVRKMPIKSPPITQRMKIQILDLARNTELHSAEIAAIFGVNPGRVSEILHKHHRTN